VIGGGGIFCDPKIFFKKIKIDLKIRKYIVKTPKALVAQ